MRTLTVGLLGTVALAAGLFLARNQRLTPRFERSRDVPAGETRPARISLDRIRALGY